MIVFDLGSSTVILWFIISSLLQVGLFFWVLDFVNWGLLFVSIFSNSLNLFIASINSDSCIFCFEVSFCLSLSVFLFGKVSVEAGGCIGDLLSFGLVLLGDFFSRVFYQSGGWYYNCFLLI